MRDGKPDKNEQRQEDFLERPLPSNEDAERCILGGILVDNKLISEAAEQLEPEDFYSPLNKKIYQAMLNLHMQGKTIDPILIIEEMKKEGPVEAMGGMNTIQQLAHGLPYFSSLAGYIEIVADTKQKRDIVRTCNQVISRTLSEEEDIDVLTDAVEQSIFSVCERPEVSRPQMVEELAHEDLTHREEMMANSIKFDGVQTGLADLDQDTGGWKKTDLIIVAGRPSMGKSALAGQFAWTATDKSGVAAFFSLEMSKKQLIARFICSEARLDLHRYMNNDLFGTEFRQAIQAKAAFRGRTLYIDDTPGLSPMQMMSKCRRIYARHKRLDLVVVDYLQLMASSQRTENRLQEVSAISRELKAVAKLLNVPVIALSQLSRAPEHRNPPRPIMSDLRESGTIEQDADIVLFVFREEYYKETDENKGIAEIILAKQRNGPTRTVKATFIRKCTRFENYTPEGY
jgi:replicative DNA helicase